MGSNSLLLAAAALAASAHAASTTKVHVVRDLQAPRGIRVVRNADAAIGSKQDVLAWAQYKNTVNETGWGLLEVFGNNSFANIDVAYAAGKFASDSGQRLHSTRRRISATFVHLTDA